MTYEEHIKQAENDIAAAGARQVSFHHGIDPQVAMAYSARAEAHIAFAREPREMERDSLVVRDDRGYPIVTVMAP